MPFFAPLFVWIGAVVTLGTVTSLTVAYTIGSIVFGTLVSWGMGSLARALMPKPNFGDIGIRGRELTVRAADAPWVFSYGPRREGGTIRFIHIEGDYLYVLIVWCYGGPNGIEAIDHIYFGDELAASGTTPAAKYSGLLTVEHKLGTDAQTASTILTGDLPSKWGATDLLSGHAYTVLKIKHDAEKLADFSVDQVRAEYRGRKVYVASSGTTVYSTNPVWCARDFATNANGLSVVPFGPGMAPADMNDSANIAEAAICDATENVKAGGTRSRYTLGLSVSSQIDYGVVIEEMTKCMGGTLIKDGNSWRFWAAAWRPPQYAFDEDDLRGPIKCEAWGGRRVIANGVKGQFTDTTFWREQSYPGYSSAAALLEDGNVRFWDELSLPGVVDAGQAQQLAKQRLERIRRQKSITAPYKIGAYRLRVRETFQLTHAHWNWTQKTFRVERIEFVTEDGDNGRIAGVNVVAVEDDAGAYYWNASVDEETYDAPDAATVADAGDDTMSAGALLLSQHGARREGPVGQPLNSEDAGADATIEIDAHDWAIIGPGPEKAHDAGSITALAFSTLYYVYADDATLQGGALTYQATTDPLDIMNGPSYRKFIGAITTPANGAGPTTGDPDEGGKMPPEGLND